jgi:hypothetical protein
MMGLMSRQKGKAGEREIAGIIRDLTGWDVRRKVRQHDGDSDLEGVPGWSVEVKRHATASRGEIRKWWEQAEAQAIKDQMRAVLFYRKDKDEWRAVWCYAWPMGHTATPETIYDWTVEGSVAVWAAVAREGI